MIVGKDGQKEGGGQNVTTKIKTTVEHFIEYHWREITTCSLLGEK